MTSRKRAFTIHLVISLAVLVPVLGWIFHAWYPWPYPVLQGAWVMLGVMVLAHLAVGPLLTALVFKPGKRGLVFDLCVIALLQAGALAWGVYAVGQQRPAWLVFAVDRLNVLSNGEIMGPVPQVPASLRNAGPVLVYAEMPTGDAAQQLLQETMFEGLPDIEHRPEFWRPWVAGRGVISRATRPVTELVAARPASAGPVGKTVTDAGLTLDMATFLPVMGRERDAAAILNPADGTLLGLVVVDPWVDEDAVN
ncbi:hypothetical protein F3N42_03210 [Marinihelvus fidelis]|uniref:Pilus assembly protein n=1 Tax=Marinihelvus fidelis TaxID=2613842 RepID=A0A5N0TFH5_9GAMM|nr:hypothetical protein [Marinihelvus fidelis]KAA9133371.1 hypothetical protein F3N42_03210 [Marinihelvus fidelis]